ncbi:MAG: hypothetical protein AAGB05_03910 [Pseudomonadota bacterium]
MVWLIALVAWPEDAHEVLEYATQLALGWFASWYVALLMALCMLMLLVASLPVSGVSASGRMTRCQRSARSRGSR